MREKDKRRKYTYICCFLQKPKKKKKNQRKDKPETNKTFLLSKP